MLEDLHEGVAPASSSAAHEYGRHAPEDPGLRANASRRANAYRPSGGGRALLAMRSLSVERHHRFGEPLVCDCEALMRTSESNATLAKLCASVVLDLKVLCAGF